MANDLTYLKVYFHIYLDHIAKTEKSLEAHLKTHIKKNFDNMVESEIIHRCHICGKIYKKRKRLQYHMEIHESTKKHNCHLCNKSFRGYDSLRRHQFWHTRQASTGIRRSFIMNRHYVLHYQLLNGAEAYMCKVCELIYSSMDDIKKHMFSGAHTSNSYTFQCVICNKYFACKKRLRHHLNYIHDSAMRKKQMQTCTVCGMQLANRPNLILHMRIHTGEKPYKCQVCDFRCSQQSGIKLHMQTHNPVSVDTCSICGKSFRYRSAFLVHVRTAHSDARLHACTQCDKTFKLKTTLQRHEKTHADIRTHICPYCSKAFLRRYNLTIHVKIHTGERPHQCSICGKGFLQKHVRDSHMKTHQ